MEKRYYYTDTLAAAWMAKHFDMRFKVAGSSGSYGLEDIVTDYVDEDGCYREPYTSRWFIYPDSLHLLDPQEWDKGRDELDKPCEFVGGEWEYENWQGDDRLNRVRCSVRIEKRGGRTFFWPSCDN